SFSLVVYINVSYLFKKLFNLWKMIIEDNVYRPLILFNRQQYIADHLFKNIYGKWIEKVKLVIFRPHLIVFGKTEFKPDRCFKMLVVLSVNSFIVQRFVVRLIVIFHAGYRHIKMVVDIKGHPASSAPKIYDTVLWLQFILLKQLLKCSVRRCFIPVVIICLLPPFPKSDSFDLQHL